jgi:hypothetical protein
MANSHDWSGLAANDSERQERAALALYDSAQRDDVLGDERAARALHASVTGGNHSAAAILLLGHVSSSDAGELLRQLSAVTDERTKLRAWSKPVAVRIPALVALARVGDSGARLALLEHIEQAPTEDLVFLLGIVREFDDPAVLHVLAKHLSDERAIGDGVPSGAAPSRRIADLTADALIDRLSLAVSFARRPAGRYTADQLQEVLRLVRGSVPQ